MSNSRRTFLSRGLLAITFAGLPLSRAFAQSWKERDANPGLGEDSQNDLLRNYSKEAFKPYLNSVFRIHTAAGVMSVTLAKITDMPAPQNGECFSLLFRGEISLLDQGTYFIEHPALGNFSLLLVPAGAFGYLATINRLSLADALNYPAPTRVFSFGTRLGAG